MQKFDKNIDIDPAAVIKSAAESILITTTDLDAPGPTVVYVNPAFEKMTGWSKEEIIGRSPRILQGPNTDKQIFAGLRQKLHAMEMWEGRTINYRKDGSQFWMEWSIVPLKNPAGEVYQYVAIQRDVSARVEARLQLRQAREAERAASRARANLARYFSPKMVEKLATKDKPLGPVRRQDLAILFADIVGFTAISETLEPEQLIELLREIHSWMEQTIFKWEGSIEGYIGDAVLAIFGFPETGDRDATNALLCAEDLLAAARDWNATRVSNGLAQIPIGVGLNYGPAVLGDVGATEFVEFTVIGDTVNVASRLQQATRSFNCDLVVGQTLVDMVRTEPACKDSKRLLEQMRRHPNFPIRGREQAVDIWIFPTDERG